MISLFLSQGYAESGSWATLIFWTGREFDSVEDAVMDLAESIHRGVESLHSQWERRKCCQETLDAFSEAAHCATCGHKIEVPKPDAEFFFWKLIPGLFTATNNDYHEIWESLDANGWGIGAPPSMEGAVCLDRAETLITDCIFKGGLYEREAKDHYDPDWQRKVVGSYVSAPKGVKVFRDD